MPWVLQPREAQGQENLLVRERLDSPHHVSRFILRSRGEACEAFFGSFEVAKGILPAWRCQDLIFSSHVSGTLV